MRVVSLVPSVTETLLAWGVEPVAVTRFCEQPGFRSVGGTKDPDIAAIVALEPDLVVMNDEENRREDHDALSAAGVDVHVVVVRTVEDAATALGPLANRLGVRPPEVHDVDPAPVVVARVFVPVWRRPWMTMNGDTYGSALLRAVGLENVCAGCATRYPEIDLEQVAALGPDLVLAPTEPYPFKDRHLAELAAVAPAQLVDGRDLFWWGTRTPAALDRLRAIAADG